ncbi:MAG: tetratricopeptide repeat protein [Chloroflexota bacterium]
MIHHKLILIVAPAGYGKTSLMIDVAHQADTPICWYSLDDLDQNPTRFLTYFVEGIKQTLPEFEPDIALTSFLDQEIKDKSQIDEVVLLLVNTIFESIDEDFFFVLDDFHFVSHEPLISYFVNSFAEQVDEHCHIAITSRTTINLSDLVLLAARSQVIGLSQSELAFQPDEIQALIKQNNQLSISDEVAVNLADATEGWITGLLLSTDGMQQGMHDRLELKRATMGLDVDHYLRQQVFDLQSPAMQQFLLKTSLMPEFNASLCQQILGDPEAGDPDWETLIEEITTRNLFVTSIDAEETWLRYHHVFQAYLQQRIADEDPLERDMIWRKLAQRYLDGRRWEEAYQILTQLGDVDAIANLVSEIGHSIIRSGQHILLNRWLSDLDETVFDRHPSLLTLWGTTSCHLGLPDVALHQHNRAIRLLRTSQQTSNLAHALLERSLAHRFKSNYQAALGDLDEVFDLLADLDSRSPLKAEALRVKGATLYRLGRCNEAIRYWHDAMQEYEYFADDENIATIYVDMVIGYISVGQFDLASTYNQNALDYWRKNNSTTWQANLLNNQGVLYSLLGQYKFAVQVLEESITLAQQARYQRIEAFALISLGDIYSTIGAFEGAQSAYNQAEEIVRLINQPFLLLYIYLARAASHNPKQHANDIANWLQKSEELARESGSEYELALCEFGRGRLALASDHINKAVTYFRRSSQQFEQSGYKIEYIQATLHLAITYDQADDLAACEQALKFLFDSVSMMDSRHPLVTAGYPVRHYLADMAKSTPKLEQNIETLIEHINEFSDNLPALRRQLRGQVEILPIDPPPLQIQTLGQTRVVLEEKVLTSTEWQKQPYMRELFFYLIAHPNGVSREALGSMIWPDSDPDQMKRQIHNTVYRLRQKLGGEVIVFDATEDRYRFNHHFDYEYDVDLFRKTLQQAQQTNDPAIQKRAFENITRIYQGAYLKEVDSLWVWTERERLSQEYLDVELNLAQLYLNEDDLQAALTCCERIWATEPTLEESYTLAMQIQAQQGNRAAVQRIYKRCRQVLQDEMGMDVTQKTKKLYETLLLDI